MQKVQAQGRRDAKNINIEAKRWKTRKFRLSESFWTWLSPTVNQLVKRGLKNKTASEDMYQDSICNKHSWMWAPSKKGMVTDRTVLVNAALTARQPRTGLVFFFVFFLGTHGTWLFRIKKQSQGQKNGCGSWEFREGDLILRKGKILKRSWQSYVTSCLTREPNKDVTSSFLIH